MTTIKTTCERCGDIELRADDLSLELDPNKDIGAYLFLCPICGMVQKRSANARVVSVLLATGVEFEVVTSNPITESEIMRFVATLEDAEDVFRLLAS